MTEDHKHKNVVMGKGGIWATVVADSVNVWGDRLTTFRLHYPRIIHSEFMTHRMFSRNASSSRAIPVSRMLAQVQDNPAMPVSWGKNQAGMQAAGEHTQKVELPNYDLDNDGSVADRYVTADEAWRESAKAAVYFAEAFGDSGYHKQVANRLLEPYQFMNVLMSTTDIENFFHLRCHEAADPTIEELAKVIRLAYNQSKPITLRYGEWHTPYVDRERFRIRNFRTGEYVDKLFYSLYGKRIHIDVEDAKKLSVSCAAQVSYRSLDTSLDKAKRIFDKLAGEVPIHASPFEHVATPFSEKEYMMRTSLSRTAQQMKDRYDDVQVDPHQMMYSGNFFGWTQYRKFLPNENIR